MFYGPTIVRCGRISVDVRVVGQNDSIAGMCSGDERRGDRVGKEERETDGSGCKREDM